LTKRHLEILADSLTMLIADAEVIYGCGITDPCQLHAILKLLNR
jgi:hypothetical protein